jgi:hypothetical protein
MARIPVTIYQGPIGTKNPAGSSGRVYQAPSSIQNRGNTLAREQFVGPGGRQLNQIQRNTQQAMSTVNGVPFLGNGGTYLSSVSFTANTPNALQHNLGRAYQGFFAFNCDGGYARFKKIAPTTATPNTAVIVVESDATVVADLWVW